jgi:hypothetical protein
MMQGEISHVYVITWSDKHLSPGVFATLERAIFHASKHGIPPASWKQINAGVWKSGTWYSDECSVIPDWPGNPIKEAPADERD